MFIVMQDFSRAETFGLTLCFGSARCRCLTPKIYLGGSHVESLNKCLLNAYWVQEALSHLLYADILARKMNIVNRRRQGVQHGLYLLPWPVGSLFSVEASKI